MSGMLLRAAKPSGVEQYSSSLALIEAPASRSIAASASCLPVGRRLAGACRDGTVRLWDAAIRQQTLTLEGYGKEASSVAFSPDGRATDPVPLAPARSWFWYGAAAMAVMVYVLVLGPGVPL
jgi:hypothetical protein